uniref:RNA-binding protein NOB1 n=1 Tax=Ditylum brightwellii TaxID=49249 RepID=A0A7S4QV47_9STRA
MAPETTAAAAVKTTEEVEALPSSPTEQKDLPKDAKPTTTTTPKTTPVTTTTTVPQEEKYNALIIDSGAIIKHSGYSTLHNAASKYYTIPAVINEIRDAKAREHLKSLPFDLQTRTPSALACSKIVEFARLTGDYASLSSVDIQVLALLYDLEMEGCNGNMDHIREKPKYKLGVGKVSLLNPNDAKAKKEELEKERKEEAKKQETNENGNGGGLSFFESAPSAMEEEETEGTVKEKDEDVKGEITPKTWAALVNPTKASFTTFSKEEEKTNVTTALDTLQISKEEEEKAISFSDIQTQQQKEEEELGGQFSDAEEDYDDDDDDDDDDEEEISDDDEISDEECDVYILDPDEYDEQQRAKQNNNKQSEGGMINATTNNYTTLNDYPSANSTTALTNNENEGDVVVVEKVENELDSDFPSLAAASAVPYEGSDDDEGDEDTKNKENDTTEQEKLNRWEENEKRKQQSLQPIPAKAGKRYNSFRKYGHVLTKQGVAAAREEKLKQVAEKEPNEKEDDTATTDLSTQLQQNEQDTTTAAAATTTNRNNQSRIIGGITMSGQGTEVEDDGEGWITCSHDIRSMKATGKLDPTGNPNKNNNSSGGAAQVKGPPMCQRAACATTDFAMQNVILQMNLELLTIDGTKVKKLKSWVMRCGACFAVYANGEKDMGNNKTMNRLFCDRCGSDFLQRVSASVDKKTGRLRLHMRKNYKHNIRGTKFSLPKPGSGNRFEGDLLLREDQLKMGAWNQKAKMSSGKKSAESMFGSDLAGNVGCHASLSQRSDIKVGFGRKNPNASKFGRERRGKKKKNTDKACGLRRY